MKLTSAFLIIFSVWAQGCKPKKPLPVNAEIANKPAPRFTISKETTFITEPVDKDGNLDYAAALNQRLGKGVTPENNANVLIWKAHGPWKEGKSMPAEFFKLMGMDELPEKGDYFINMHDYAKQHLKVDFAQERGIDDQLVQATRRPWTAEDFPEIDAWLKANSKPLAIIIEASKRTYYFSPLTPLGSEKGSSSLAGALIPNMLTCLNMAKSFACRAMQHLSAGRNDNAWQDLVVCHRLGRLLGRGGMFIDRMLGYGIEIIASQAELAFLEHAKIDAKSILKSLSDLDAMPAVSDIADDVDLGERLFMLEQVMLAAREGISRVEIMLLWEEFEFSKAAEREKAKPDPLTEALLDDVDWDPALHQCNKSLDRVVAALRESDRGKREKKLQEWEDEINELKKDRPKANDVVKAFTAVKSDPAAKSQLICKLIAGSGDSTRNILRGRDRHEQLLRNLHLAFALAAYQRDNAKYPEKLEALAPKYLAKIPNDLFTDRPLVYRPNEKGYLLYSFGPDGKDNDGKAREDDISSDDIAVRMPIPRPKSK